MTKDRMRLHSKAPVYSLFPAVMASFIASASAADSILCEEKPALETLEGSFVLTTGPSTLFGGGKAVPLANTSSTPVTLIRRGDGLGMTGEGVEVALTWVEPDEPNWAFGASNQDPGITSDDLELLIGCDISSLPRLFGQGESVSQEGKPISFSYRLIVTDVGAATTLFGGLEWTDGEIRLLSRAMVK